MKKKDEGMHKKRIENILNLIFRIASGDLKAREKITKAGDEYDAIISGLIMLTEELEESQISLENSREYQQKVIQSMSNILIVLNPIGNIEMGNHAIFDILGYKEKEIINKDLDMLVMEKVNYKKMVYHLLEKEIIRNWEIQCIKKNGQKLPALFSSTIMRDTSDEILGFVCIIQDISKQKSIEKELQNLTRRIIQIQEEERSRIAMEIHDEFNQDLFGLKLNIQAMNSTNNQLTKETRDSFKELVTMINTLMTKASALSNQLSPIGLKYLGLNNALDEMAHIFQTKYEFKIEMNTTDIDIFFRDKWDMNFYRIIQEALTNISKHAKATEVLIEAKIRNKSLYTMIKDNGCGFNIKSKEDYAINSSKLGLSIMKERARLLGGHLDVFSNKGKGTIIEIEIPS